MTSLIASRLHRGIDSKTRLRTQPSFVKPLAALALTASIVVAQQNDQDNIGARLQGFDSYMEQVMKGCGMRPESVSAS